MAAQQVLVPLIIVCRISVVHPRQAPYLGKSVRDCNPFFHFFRNRNLPAFTPAETIAAINATIEVNTSLAPLAYERERAALGKVT